MSQPSAGKQPEKDPAQVLVLSARWRSLLFLLIAVALVAPIFAQPSAFVDTYDARYFQAWLEAGRRSLLWFSELPLWNPWTCGGQVYLANPQSTIASPTFVWVLLFGAALGSKLIVVTYLWLALDGMYRLARAYGLFDDAALLAAILFAGSGWFALHLSVGHLNFAGAALLPYMLLYQRRAQDQIEWSIPLGALMAWTIGLGGTTTPAIATVFLGLMTGVELFQRRSARPLCVLLAALVATVLIGAVRLLPALEFAKDHPRSILQTDFNILPFLFKSAVIWQGASPVFGKPYAFHEYGWKLPILIWPLLVCALRRPRARWDLWLLFVFGLTIAAGSALPFGPWVLLKKLPLFRDLRVPSRYIVLTAFAASLLAASSAGRLLANRPYRRTAMWLLFAIFAGESIAYSVWLYGKTPLRAFAIATQDSPFFQVQSHWSRMLPDLLQNRGVIGCDEEAPLQRAKELDLGDVPQARLLDPQAGRVNLTQFAPSRLRLQVELSVETLVLLNTNWNEHWRTNIGRIEKFGEKHPRDRDGGRLAVRLPAGTHDLVVRYRPASFVVGLWTSLLAGTALLLGFGWATRRRRSSMEPTA